jgi:polar amino acid transport system substrate-binding protein
MAYRSSLFGTLIVLTVLDLFAGVADSQEPAPPRTRLVVGLIQSPPFCMRDDDGSWSGISVELWREIAADLGIETEFRETTVTGLFDDLAPGRPLDVSIGALTITPEREDWLDFTQPFYLSGLGVAVKTARAGCGSGSGECSRGISGGSCRGVFVALVVVALLIWAGAQGQLEGVWR